MNSTVKNQKKLRCCPGCCSHSQCCVNAAADPADPKEDWCFSGGSGFWSESAEIFNQRRASQTTSLWKEAMLRTILLVRNSLSFLHLCRRTPSSRNGINEEGLTICLKAANILYISIDPWGDYNERSAQEIRFKSDLQFVLSHWLAPAKNEMLSHFTYTLKDGPEG